MDTTKITIEVDLAKVLFIAMTTYLAGSFLSIVHEVVADDKKNQRKLQQLRERCERILDRIES